MENNSQGKWMSFATILICGSIAFGLTVISDIIRVQEYEYLMDSESQLQCVYPSSHASFFGYSAIGLIIIAQSVGACIGGCFCRRERKKDSNCINFLSFFSFILSWVFFVAAIALLVTSCTENDYHIGNKVLKAQNSCSLLNAGLFSAGGLLGLLAAIFSVAYLYLDSREEKRDESDDELEFIESGGVTFVARKSYQKY